MFFTATEEEVGSSPACRQSQVLHSNRTVYSIIHIFIQVVWNLHHNSFQKFIKNVGLNSYGCHIGLQKHNVRTLYNTCYSNKKWSWKWILQVALLIWNTTEGKFWKEIVPSKSLIITFVQIQKWGKFHWTVGKKNAILAFKSLGEWLSRHVLNKFLPNCLGFLEETLIFQILFKYFYFNEITLFWLDEQLQ